MRSQLNFTICEAKGVNLDNEHWHKQVPKLVETSHESKIITLWNPLQTNKTMPNNKLDILIHDKETWKRMLIYAEILDDRNVIQTAAEKILKNKNLQYK